MLGPGSHHSACALYPRFDLLNCGTTSSCTWIPAFQGDAVLPFSEGLQYLMKMQVWFSSKALISMHHITQHIVAYPSDARQRLVSKQQCLIQSILKVAEQGPDESPPIPNIRTRNKAPTDSWGDWVRVLSLVAVAVELITVSSCKRPINPQFQPLRTPSVVSRTRDSMFGKTVALTYVSCSGHCLQRPFVCWPDTI
jgi:hypothetical protein